MSTARPWYKRYPAQFIAGTYRLTAEEKGVYSVLLDLMYDRGGPLEDDAKELARICGCSTRRFNTIKKSLADRHKKIVITDGLITNPRALEQIGNGSFCGEKDDDYPAISGHLSQDKSPLLRPDASDSNGLAGVEEDGEKRKITPPPPPSGGADSGLETFKAAWPNSDKQKPPVERLFLALGPPDREAAIAGIATFFAEAKRLERSPCTARTYLAERRWEGLKAEAEAKRTTKAEPLPSGISITATDIAWKRWKAAYEAMAAQGEPEAKEQLVRMAERELSRRPIRVPSLWPPSQKPVPRELLARIGADPG